MRRGLRLGFVAACNEIYNVVKSSGNRFYLILVMLMMSGGMFGQTWNYNFGTGTGTHTSTTASTTFLPTPTSGTARVRSGATGGKFDLVNSGLATLGTDTELQITGNTGSTATTKFSIYDYTASKNGYVKFKIAFSNGTNGVFDFNLGDGSYFSDSNNSPASVSFAGIKWAYGASNAITYTVLSGASYVTTGITGSTTLFTQSTTTVYEVEIYYNNTTSSTSYTRGGSSNTLTNAKWDLWVNGTKVGANLTKGNLGTNANIDSFAFAHQTSVSSPSGILYLDDLEYSNSLPTTPTYTLTYNGNTNTTGTAPIDGSSPYISSATVTVLGNTGILTKTDYNFSGWNTASDGSGTDRAVGSTFSMPAANTTLYAKWTGNVTYDANGGTGTVTDATNYAPAQSVTTQSGAGFTRSGYTFIGWNTLANGLGTSYTANQMGAFNFAGNTTLYAVWNPVGSHTVIFEANGGTGSMANQTESASAALTTNAFTRAGYTFANWNTAANGSGTTYTNGQTYAFDANMTLYAQWTANNNTITFDANTGTGTMAAQTLATGATAALNANTFTKAGYTFAGWATTAGGAVAYANSASYSMGTSNVTLYAKWTANNNTITFNGNGSTSGTMANQTIATDASANLTTNAFVRTGYTFASWNTASDGSGTTYANGASYVMGTSNVTLYAQWDVYVGPCFSDNFNSNYGNWTGGSGTYNNSSAANSGNGIGFNDNNDNIITSSSILDPESVSFKGKANNTSGNYTIRVQTSTASTGPWSDVSTFTANGSNTGTITDSWFDYDVTLNLSGNYYIRIIQNPRTGGSFFLDDLEIFCAPPCAPPTPTFTSSIPATACASSNITYTTQSGKTNYIWNVSGTLGTDYTIYNGDLGTSSNSVILKWLTVGDKTVTVGYTDAGCASTTPASFTTTISNATIVAPAAAQNILSGANGTELTVTETGTVTSRSWRYGTLALGPYGTNTGATGPAFTPNFASAGTYYVVCQTIYVGGCVVISNPVQINVTDLPNIVLSSSDPASTTGNLVQGSNNNVIYGFNLDVTSANATLSSVVFNTVGGYSSAEVSNYKLWYSTDAIFNSASDTQIGSALVASGAGSSKTFSGFSRVINSGSTGYFFITTDVPCTADGTSAHTLRVNAITTAGLTFTAGNKSGTASNGATHTFTSATPNNATAFTTTVCQNGAATLTWTNAAGCRDEVYVFAKAGAFSSAVPTGDGSTYTANSTFAHASATTFDGGYLIYKGSLATASVSGLTNGTNYTYKIFTRNDSNWSSGATVSCTPSLAYCTPTGSLDCSTWNDYISNVTLNTLNYTSTCGAGGYTIVPAAGAQTTILTQGQGYTFSLTSGPGTGTHGAGVYFDWNQDGDFIDPSEFVLISSSITANNTATVTVTVPAGAAIGSTRMRVRYAYEQTPTFANSCSISGIEGETEDYTISVIAPCTPAANPVGTIAGTTPACTSTVLTYAAADAANAYWQSTATGTSFAEPVSSTTKTVSTSSTHYLRIHDGNCWSTNSISYAVVINAATVITVQPSSTYAVVGNTASFTVTATGTGLSYQWQQKIGAGSWTNVGTNSNSFTTPATTLAMDGYLYQVIVSGTCGNVTSGSALLSVGTVSLCNPIWEENFDTGCADNSFLPNINSNWTRNSGSDNDFGYNAIGLSYSGYISSGVGGSAEFILGGGDDIRREFSSTSLTSGPVYASFLINMSSGTTTSNEYVLGLTDASGTNHGRVYVGKSGSQYRLGVSKQSSGTPNNQTGLLNFGTTYLVVIKYNMKNEAGNTDTFELWVLSSGIPADEASAGTSITSTTSGTDATNLKYFALRQTGTYEGFVDGIRVGTTWADVVCNGTPASKTYTWTGGAGSTLWTAAGNWSPAGVPGTIDNIIINTAPTSLLNITDCRQVKDFTLNGTGNFSIASTGTLTITGNITYGGTPTATLHCDSYVYITSSSAQTIPAINYGNLDALGGDRIFPNGATIGICAGFNVDPTVHNYTVTGSTINYFSSETGWGMFPFTYHNLTFSGTGSFSMGGGWDSYSGTKVVNVLGNFRQTNGTVNMTTNLYDFSNSSTLNITGNMEISGGTFNMKEGSDSSVAVVNLQGDLTVSTGTLTTSGSATSNFNFTGTGDGLTAATTQTVSVVPNPQRTTFNINNGAYVKLIDQNFGLGTDSRLNVNSGGTLDFGFNSSNTALNVSGGSATFDSKTGSILKITSPGGIASSGATGNVRANTRLFATASPYASYHYIGKANQDTGSALPANVNNLTINNESSSSDVTLTSTVAVNNTLTMASGNIVTGANRLDLGISTAVSGTLNHTEGVVKGTMRRWFNTATNSGDATGLFPMGTATSLKRFAKIEFNVAPTVGGYITALLNESPMGNAGLATLTTVPLTGTCPAFSVLSTDDSFWNLTPTTLTGGTYTITLRKQSSSTIDICKQTVLKRDLTDWLNPGNHVQPSGTSSDVIVSRSGLSGLIKDFGLGNANCPATSIVYNGSWPGSVLPTHLDTVEFTEDYPLDNGVIQMCECKVIAGKTVTIASGATLQLMNGITLEPGVNPDGSEDGQLIIEDGGSLVQVTDVDNATANNNTGKIQMHRNTKPMYRYDFTYWSSPVFANDDPSDDAASVLNGTEFNLKKLSPYTLFDKYYKWNHAAATPGWQTIPVGAESMVPGRGYIVRAPQTYGTDPLVPESYATYNANFIGVPNNGTVRHDVSGPDKWNLLGNPYPSAISADLFFEANVGSANGSTNTLEGSIYLWTHNSEITETGTTGIYTYSNGDYACYNGTGSTDTKESENDDTPDDPDDNKPTGYIAAGQSFFIKGTATGEAVFNNSMRIAGNNNQFFRPATPEPLNNWDTTGKHRIWLNMKGQTKGFNQLLVGYVENATNELDIRFDGESFGGNQVTFYSILGSKNLTIQGRALPFNNQDEVPLGYKSTLNGTLTISIDEYDGLFEGQDIYLEDKVLDIVHDLKAAAYNFTTIVGTFNDRFVLRYLPSEQLSNPGHENIANGLIVYQEDNKIIIKSQLEALEQVTVYDLLGRTIFDKTSINRNECSIENVVMNEQPLIVKVKLANGQTVNKKIVY